MDDYEEDCNEIEARRKYMRDYYYANKYKWAKYYQEVVLPRYKQIKLNRPKKCIKKIHGSVIIIFD